LVNSAYYGFYRQISSISHAIVMLGFLEVRNLTLTATAFRTLGAGTSDYDRVQLWRHSLATAMAAEKLGKLLRLEMEGIFESGLLHDIGKVALDLLYPEEFRTAAHLAHTEKRFMFQTEQQIFGVDHAAIGGLLGEHWNLPQAVVEAIRFHHAPEKAELNPALTQLISAGNILTYQAGLGEFSNGLAPEITSHLQQALGLTPAICAEVVEMLQKSHEKIDEFLGALNTRTK
jgi:putative nucleotidyltransferase with HDIG domain